MSAGTRVFKKSSPNGKITAYLGKRDYIDHISYTDPIDGVVLIDPEYIKDRKVFVKLLCAFRYGREDLDVLGLTFRKDFCSISLQVFPPLSDDHKKPKTRLQERLIKKLGEHAYPFFVEIPKDSPCSVTLQPAPGDTGKPCGVDYELKTYVSEDNDDKIHKRNSVRLAIRKVQFAPDKKGRQPTAEIQKQFLMSDKPLCLEATLDKDLYYHGETIGVNVQVTNNSSKTVKKIKISVRQLADICLFSNAQYKCPVAVLDADDQVAPSSTLCKVYQICPLLGNNKDKRGLALDGQLKHEDTNLASSTILKEGIPKENLGIIVRYKVKVKLTLGGLGGEVCVELPVTLMHSKPVDAEPSSSAMSPNKSDENKAEGESKSEESSSSIDHNLISFDANIARQDDDIVFEDFARMRLQGETGNQRKKTE
ncbi:beta-arrestin-1-like [Clavelina lepadiformis]|uniref:Arrestin C-terminal-like domain-containing protein n=1 Tax=Clavelina lepadiformis TaxID=159417 RepID=A0ABP0GG26_CLALP